MRKSETANTLADQLTAALRLECAVADGKMELHRGAGPGGMDLYEDKADCISGSLNHSTRDGELRYSGAHPNVTPLRRDLRPEERSGPQSNTAHRAGRKPQPVNAGAQLRRGAELGSGSQKYMPNGEQAQLSRNALQLKSKATEHVPRYRPRVSNKAASPGCGTCVAPCVGCSTGAMVSVVKLASKPAVRFRGPVRPPVKGKL